jgi:hypothetical protein
MAHEYFSRRNQNLIYLINLNIWRTVFTLFGRSVVTTTTTTTTINVFQGLRLLSCYGSELIF